MIKQGQDNSRPSLYVLYSSTKRNIEQCWLVLSPSLHTSHLYKCPKKIGWPSENRNITFKKYFQ